MTYAKVESLPVFAMVGYAVLVNLVMTPNDLLFPVTIQVLDDLGRPVPGALVEWSGSRETDPRVTVQGRLETDATGSLTLGAIAAGPLKLIAMSARGDLYLGASLVADVIGAPMKPITVRLRPASRVLGRVEFTDRRTPLHGNEGLRVWLQREGGFFSGNQQGLINADGTFWVGPVAGEGCLPVRGIPYGWRLSEILHRGEDLQHRFVQFDAEEIYDLVVRIEPGIDDSSSAEPICVRE